MSLPDSYLEYPRRRRGYDHDLYEWSAIHERAATRWPGNRSVAVWLCVSLEWFPILPSDDPFRAPGHMVTPYPDYRHYTAREYGTRVGVYRLLEAFAKAGVKASFATSGAIADRYPELVREIVDAGHEIVAHSTDMNGTIASGMEPGAEEALIAQSLASLEAVTGERPNGWLSIARSQSFETVDHLKAAGLAWCADWVNDELPWRFKNGLINLPLNHELSDRQICVVQQQNVDSYAQSMRDAFDWLAGEASGRLLPMQLTPYIIGLPYRIDTFETLLADLAGRGEAWFATGGEIVREWAAQHPVDGDTAG